MRQFLSIVTGYREDLDLQGRWWHRLAKVVYVLLIAMVLIAVGVMASDRTTTDLDVRNVNVTAKFSDIWEKHPEAPNLIPVFLALPGTLGRISETTGELTYSYDSYNLSRAFCTPDAQRHIVETTE